MILIAVLGKLVEGGSVKDLNMSKKDACYSKVKSRYKVFPSAYASGAIAKCRKVGAKNWGKSPSKTKRAIGGAVMRGYQGRKAKMF